MYEPYRDAIVAALDAGKTIKQIYREIVYRRLMERASITAYCIT